MRTKTSQKRTAPNTEDTVNADGKLLNQQPACNKILQSEVSLQLEESPNGTVADTYDENPFLNAMIYEVKFPDGQLKEHAANVLAKDILTQVHSDGSSLTVMEAMTDHQKDEAATVAKTNKHVATTSGQKRLSK
jgi:hypothetical protein